MKKLILVILLLPYIVSCNKLQKPSYHYYEYGCVFELTNGCKSTSQTTVRVNGSLTFDQIKSNISNWVKPFKIKDIQVWYLKEITSGEMYYFSDKFSCHDIGEAFIRNNDTVKNTNNYITFKFSK